MTKTLKTERQVMMLAMAATLIAMTRLEYNQFRGWELPADENGADEGYLVEYVGPGQKPNNLRPFIQSVPIILM